jgi:hypothetical protein
MKRTRRWYVYSWLAAILTAEKRAWLDDDVRRRLNRWVTARFLVAAGDTTACALAFGQRVGQLLSGHWALAAPAVAVVAALAWSYYLVAMTVVWYVTVTRLEVPKHVDGGEGDE